MAISASEFACHRGRANATNGNRAVQKWTKQTTTATLTMTHRTAVRTGNVPTPSRNHGSRSEFQIQTATKEPFEIRRGSKVANTTQTSGQCAAEHWNACAYAGATRDPYEHAAAQNKPSRARWAKKNRNDRAKTTPVATAPETPKNESRIGTTSHLNSLGEE